MWIILTSVVFLIMILIPFIIAIKELLYPKDDKPLYIDMKHSKDPFYFGTAFKEMVKRNIEQVPFTGQTLNVKFSKDESVEIFNEKSLPEDSLTEKIFYIQKDFETGDRTMMRKDVYVKGVARMGKKNVLRAIYGEDDIFLGEKNHITRWASSEKDLVVSINSRLGRSTTSRKRLILAPGCRFQALAAYPVLTVTKKHVIENTAQRRADELLDFTYPVKNKPGKKMVWRIVKKHVSINCEYEPLTKKEIKEKKKERTQERAKKKEPQLNMQTDKAPIVLPQADQQELRINGEICKIEGGRNCCNTESGLGACSEKFWDVTNRRVTIARGTVITTNFVVRKELLVKENSRIHGAIRSFKNIFFESNVEVHGDIFAEGSIFIGDNCTLMGNIFSQSGVYMGEGVRISTPGNTKSVIGKKKIEIGKNAVIYGYLLTEGEGIVKW